MPRPIFQGSLAARNLRARLANQIESDELELPLLPETAAQVLSACQEGTCEAREVASLIERDPSLAGHVLRVTNSAAFAPAEPIVSLQQAVSRLGFGALCGIAVSVIMQGEVFRIPGHEERLGRIWRHSARAAGWAKEIARLRRKNVEGAFMCGLLHDVGKPIVMQALSGVVELVGFELPDEIWDDWLDEFHAEVGVRLLASWDMPEWMLEPILHHHTPEQADAHVDETRTICLANEIAHALEADDEAAFAALRAHPVLCALGLYVDELDGLLERHEIVDSTAEVLAP
ncbi:MAG: HDOD domain-containing protein [bacterium]|nr:HDOD domain-containing protein [bacterium]